MCLALHPCWSGQPHRIRYVDEVLDYIVSHEGVWLTTAGAIADYYYQHCYDRMLAHVARLNA